MIYIEILGPEFSQCAGPGRRGPEFRQNLLKLKIWAGTGFKAGRGRVLGGPPAGPDRILGIANAYTRYLN